MAGLGSIRADIQEVGMAATATYVLGKALRKLKLGDAVYYLVMDVDLLAVSEDIDERRRRDGDFVAVEKSDTALFQPDTAEPIVLERFATGAHCHALLNRSQVPLAWIWHTQQRYDEDEVAAAFLLPANAVWDFGVYVLPEHRAGRSLETLWQRFAEAMVAQGKSRSISRIGAHNRASLRAHRRLPHRLLGKCAFFRLGRFQFSFSSVKPHVHVCASPGGAPVFVFGL